MPTMSTPQQRHKYYLDKYGPNYKTLMKMEVGCDRGRAAVESGKLDQLISEKKESKGKKGDGKKNKKKNGKGNNNNNGKTAVPDKDPVASDNTLSPPTKTVNLITNPFGTNAIRYKDLDESTTYAIVDELVEKSYPTGAKAPIEVDGNLVLMVGEGDWSCELKFGIIEQGVFVDIWGLKPIYSLKLIERLSVWASSSDLSSEAWACITLDENWAVKAVKWVHPFRLRNFPHGEIEVTNIYGNYKSRNKLHWLDLMDSIVRQQRIEVYLDVKKEEYRYEAENRTPTP